MQKFYSFQPVGLVACCSFSESDLWAEGCCHAPNALFQLFLVFVIFFTWGQFWPSGIVIAFVCGSVCPCVCINHELVRTITHRSFKLGSPNLDQRHKTPRFRPLTFLGMINLELQGQIQLESQILPHFELVRTITHQPFKLESPNLDRKYILALLRCLLILDLISFDLHFHFQSGNLFFYQICLRSFCIIFSETRRL